MFLTDITLTNSLFENYLRTLKPMSLNDRTYSDDRKERSRERNRQIRFAITQSRNSLQRVKQHDIGSV